MFLVSFVLEHHGVVGALLVVSLLGKFRHLLAASCQERSFGELYVHRIAAQEGLRLFTHRLGGNQGIALD